MKLSACCSCLYGRVHDELRYTLRIDPKEVHGDNPSTLLRAGFPGETFRVLKEKEERLYGEYRTRRLVMAAWDGERKV